MKRDLNDIRDALYSDGTHGQALIHQVEQLARISDRERFSLRPKGSAEKALRRSPSVSACPKGA